MRYGKRFVLAVLCCALLAGGAWAEGESSFYTFDRNVDATWWPDSPPGLLPDDGWWTDDSGVSIYNYTNNNVFVDGNYQAAGNSGLIQGSALWGNPKSSPWWPMLNFEFYDTPLGYADTVSFNFAWAIAGDYPPSELWIGLSDSEGNYEDVYYPLDQFFNAGPAFGGFEGAGGSVYIEPVGSLTNIESMSLNLELIATAGGTGEFAIDNFSLNGGTGGGGDPTGDPLDSSLYVATDIGELEGLLGVGTNRLRSSFGGSFELFVHNDGSGSTTFSVQVDPGGMDPGTPAVNETIHPGQWASTGTLVSYDANMLSGMYEATATIVNDLNPSDGDDEVYMRVTIYDPPQVTDNTASVIDPAVAGTVWLANAAAGPHAGAQRAGVEITGITITGGFGLNGIAVNDFVAADEQLNGQVVFNALGKLAGHHQGVLTIAAQMNSAADGYLNGRTPMGDLVWQLTFSVPTITDNTASVGGGGDFAGLGINDEDTAAALIGGTSSTEQEVTLAFAVNPEAGGPGTAALAGQAVDIHFEQDGDLYVLQLTYDDTNLPPGMLETDLRLLYFDPDLNAWIDAIDANSDGGAGEQFHLGSFSDFVATLGGGPLPLSAHGLDIEENTVWAVLNHASVFATGVVPAPSTGAPLALGLLAFARRQRRR